MTMEQSRLGSSTSSLRKRSKVGSWRSGEVTDLANRNEAIRAAEKARRTARQFVL